MSAVVTGSRQRFAERRRRRRWRSARPLVVLAAAGVLAAVVLSVVWFTSVFGVRNVEVVGAGAVSEQDITAAAEVRSGEPLARVDVDAVRSRVAALPGVAAVRVRRAWPSTLRITVTERVAVAVAREGGGLWLVDAQGVLFQQVTAAPGDLPTLRFDSFDPTDPRVRAALAVTDALPAQLRTQVGNVSAAGPESVELTMRDGRTVHWGGATKNDQKVLVLPALLRQPGSVYDVSTPSVVVVR